MIKCICEKLQRFEFFRCICLRLEIKKRAKNIKRNKKKIPPYLLTDNYEKELNYKLWTTKGARFAASDRNQNLHKLSTLSIGFLSSYLIIIGITSAYKIDISSLLKLNITITDNKLGFVTTALSILILIFSQLESSENFLVKAEKHHNCALDIAELYNQLRFNKSFIKNEVIKKFELEKINNEYDRILKKYENHINIDYKIFQLKKHEYFNLNRLNRIFIWLQIQCKVGLKYYILMFSPIITFLIFKYLN